jgi:hypothetical protein
MSKNSERLELYYAAEAAILRGQATKVADRELTRADLRWVQNEIQRLESLVAAETPGAGASGGFKAATFASTRAG